jgi:hypothetical protein
MSDIERDNKGQITKEERLSPETEFSEGEHWRDEKPYWHEWWLRREYHLFQRSASEIADDWGVTENAILYWLDKHDIDTRSMEEVRKIKDWAVSGEENGMYGRTGEDNPNWKGGVTPERQDVYASEEWREAVRRVWLRDEAACQRCEIQADEVNDTLHVHHIHPFDHKDKRTDVDNLILLCPDCHSWVHSRKNENNKYTNP